MKTIKMYCENCGKEFYSEYYDGGYIDHVINMVRNFRIEKLEEMDRIIGEICKDGNDYRELDDIDDRLKCHIIWLNKQKVSAEIIKEIEEKVKDKKKYIENLLQIRKEIQDRISNLDDYSARRFVAKNLSV